MKHEPLPLLVGLLLLAGACASQGGPEVVTADDLNRRNATIITTAELRAANELNVYDVVAARRPHWLRKRGSVSFENEGDIVVYLDNGRLGGPDALRQIQALTVTSVRFYDAAAANYRFGVGHHHGAIQVSSK